MARQRPTLARQILTLARQIMTLARQIMTLARPRQTLLIPTLLIPMLARSLAIRVHVAKYLVHHALVCDGRTGIRLHDRCFAKCHDV